MPAKLDQVVNSITLLAGGSIKDSSGDVIVDSDGNLGAPAGVASAFTPGLVAAVANAVTSSSAIGVATYNTTVNTTSGALALTLAAGAFKGQLRRVQLIVDGGSDATLTFNTNATIVFADVGDVAELLYTGTAWVPTALYNCADGATAPVYTPAS